uniref:Rad21_Rec8_N domain-containing protein n=1 Tax=Rhabditophanes sp. KR3021 TaxID=114890 RepID=A0AC35UBR8_9BILA
MFYSQLLLSKKGSLSKIWIAAHCEKKLTKAQVLHTNVEEEVNKIITPTMQMSLRTNAHLMYGIVRIHSRQLKYLLTDCSDALLKIKMSFRAGDEEKLISEVSSISSSHLTVPGVIQDFNFTINEFNERDLEKELLMNQTRISSITITEDTIPNIDPFNITGDLNMLNMDDLINMAEAEAIDSANAFAASQISMDKAHEVEARKLSKVFGTSHNIAPERERRESIFANSGNNEHQEVTMLQSDINMSDMHMMNNMDEEVGVPMDGVTENVDPNDIYDVYDEALNMTSMSNIPKTPVPHRLEEEVDVSVPGSFNLEPLDETIVAQVARGRRVRKRKELIIDEVLSLRSGDVRRNNEAYLESLKPPNLAPPTKKLMRLMDFGTANQMFSRPMMSHLVDDSVLRYYKSCCVPREKVFQAIAEPITYPIVGNDLVLDENFDNNSTLPVPLADQMDATYDATVNDLGNVSLNIPLQAMEDLELQIPQQFEEDFDNGNNDFLFNSPEPEDTNIDRTDYDLDQTENDPKAGKFSQKSQRALKVISQKIVKSQNSEIIFTDLIPTTKSETSKKLVAQRFYALLELAKMSAIEVEQNEPYGIIKIKPGTAMSSLLSNISSL